MKKIVLSTIVLTAISLADTTSSAEIEALKAQMASMQKQLASLESNNATTAAPKKHSSTTVKSHVPILKFSGTHYLGFVSNDDKTEGGDTSNKFETRRNYLQVKAYMAENPKDYMRITLDTHTNKNINADVDGSQETIIKGGETGVRLKYAYLYLDNVLPNTGVEFGQAHRPWIDYEEHNAWNYRSISKVMVEEKNAGHLTNSADRGINFKTKTPYFSSELGVFNGEGYHNEEDGERLSGEWRLTGHLLGTGKKKAKKSNTYANVSFFGQENKLSNKHQNEDLNWMGLHAVYNQPEFLLAAQYIDVNDATEKYKGDGYSINGEYRVTKDWNVIARYDNFDMAEGDYKDVSKKRTLAGVSYEYNKNVDFIANYLKTDVSGNTDTTKDVDSDAIMLTAQVEW